MSMDKQSKCSPSGNIGLYILDGNSFLHSVTNCLSFKAFLTWTDSRITITFWILKMDEGQFYTAPLERSQPISRRKLFTLIQMDSVEPTAKGLTRDSPNTEICSRSSSFECGTFSNPATIEASLNDRATNIALKAMPETNVYSSHRKTKNHEMCVSLVAALHPATMVDLVSPSSEQSSDFEAILKRTPPKLVSC